MKNWKYIALKKIVYNEFILIKYCKGQQDGPHAKGT